MRSLKRIATVVYLLACVAVLGSYALSLAGPFRARMVMLRNEFPVRVILLVCIAVMAVQALVVVIRAIFERPEPKSVHPSANPNIEVTCGALQAVARQAAEGIEDVLIEEVRVRVRGRDQASACVSVDAIALTDTGLEGLAHRMQQRIEESCERMLGCPGVSAQVRFLPSRTVTATKEAFRG